MNVPNNPDALACRPKVEVADLFKGYAHYLPQPLYKNAAKVVRDIIDCRTRKLGGHVRQCDDCRHEEISYNSCRNRHCPKCQFLARAEWVEARIDELLPVEYFHVVFTLPHELNRLILQNKKELYNLLFDSASATLKEVTQSKIHAEAGFIAVLHTWDQKLMEHPHLHVIIPGGGLRKSKSDGIKEKEKNEGEIKDEWIPSKRGFLLPVKILSKVFRGKYLSGLEKLHKELKFEGQLATHKDERRFKKLLQAAARKDWVVYAKPPFAGPEQVFNYLGNYTHRIAISNHRLVKIENDHITFRYRDSANENKKKVMTLHIREFIRRFLLHVLPPRFVRIRHYGFLGNRSRKEKVERLKNILIPNRKEEAIKKNSVDSSPEFSPSPVEKPDWKEKLKELTGKDLTLCPECKTGKMTEVRVIESFWDRQRHHHKKPKVWDTS